MNAWWKTTGAAVIAIAVIATGCGRDEDSSSASADSSSSKEAFVEQANALCRAKRKNAYNRAIAYQKQHSSDGLSQAELGKKAIRAVELSTYGAEIAALRKLQAPAEDQERIDSILDAQEAALEEGKKVPVKTGTNRTQASEIIARFTAADKPLRAYGLTDCTKD